MDFFILFWADGTGWEDIFPPHFSLFMNFSTHSFLSPLSLENRYTLPPASFYHNTPTLIFKTHQSELEISYKGKWKMSKQKAFHIILDMDHWISLFFIREYLQKIKVYFW